MDDLYRLIERRLDELRDEMRQGFQTTNTRLKSLELWRAGIAGAVALLGILWVVANGLARWWPR